MNRDDLILLTGVSSLVWSLFGFLPILWWIIFPDLSLQWILIGTGITVCYIVTLTSVVHIWRKIATS